MVASKGLEDLNIEFERSHAKVKTLPKGLALRVDIDPENKVIVEVSIEEDVTDLNRYVPNNFSQFPYPNITKIFSFYEVEKFGKKDSKSKFDKKLFWKHKQEVLRYMRTFPDVWNLESEKSKEKDRIKRILELSREAASLLEKVPDLNPVVNAIDEQVKESLCIPNDFFSICTPQKLLRTLQYKAVRMVEKCTDIDLLEKYRKLFFFASKSTDTTFPLLIEPIHPNVLIRSFQAQNALIDIAEALDTTTIRPKKWKTKFGENDKDAFANKATGADERTFPEVKLPIVGNVILRSQNDDIPCNNRYGEFKSDGFPVGKDTRDKARKTLTWLVQKDHLGKIWTKINYHGDNQPQLLVVYPESLQLDEQGTSANIVTGLMTENDVDKNTYEENAKELVKGIDKLIKIKKGSASVRLLTFRKMDKSRTGVDISMQLTFESIQQAVQSWLNACKNLPEMRIAGLSEERIVPYPVLSLFDQLNTVWKKDRGDIRAEPTPRFKFRRALMLQFGLSSQSDLKYMLRTLTNNSYQLLEHLTRQSIDFRHGKAEETKTGTGNMLAARKVLHLMAALLWYLNIKKEEYVNDSCFLLGRMLNASDWLHELYCVHVRDGGFPPQFLGSAQLQLAYNNPQRAIAQLSVRLKPYVAWAKRSKSSDENIGKAFGMMRNIMQELEVVELPNRTNEIQKALIMKGFLAKSASKPKSEG